VHDIRDRDGIYGDNFHGRAEGMGIEQVQTAAVSTAPETFHTLARTSRPGPRFESAQDLPA